MNKKAVLEMVKVDLNRLVQELNLTNVQETKEKVTHYFHLVETLIPLIEDESMEDKPVEETNSIENQVEPSEGHSTDTEENVYVFDRKLRGGFLRESEIYVPESIIRTLDLEDGDIVQAIERPNEPGRYIFEIIQKGEQDQVLDRAEIKYGLVEKDGELLVVSKTFAGENITILDAPHSFLLRDKDIKDHQLQEGNIVDIAYSKSKPEIYKVVWKYKHDALTSSLQPTPMKVQNSSKSKDKHDEEERMEGEECLENKNILVIGCEPRKAHYKMQFESRGANFFMAEGTEGWERLRSFIVKSDVVLILITFIRHQASYDAVDICKTYQIPFKVIDGVGIKSVLKGAIDTINEG